MRKVLVFGTFDIFHEGHRNFLKQAQRHGDFLRVVIARDANVEKIKKQRSVNNEQERLQKVVKSGLADEVVLGSLTDKYDVIKEFRPDVICLGYDQKFFIDNLRGKLNEFGLQNTEVVRLKAYHPEEYKSSKLRNH